MCLVIPPRIMPAQARVQTGVAVDGRRKSGSGDKIMAEVKETKARQHVSSIEWNKQWADRQSQAHSSGLLSPLHIAHKAHE